MWTKRKSKTLYGEVSARKMETIRVPDLDGKWLKIIELVYDEVRQCGVPPGADV
jgi:hypothetical protein